MLQNPKNFLQNPLSQMSCEIKNYMVGMSGIVDLMIRSLSQMSIINKDGEPDLAKMSLNNESLKELLELANLLAPHSREATYYMQDIFDVGIRKICKIEQLENLEEDSFKVEKVMRCNIVGMINIMLISRNNMSEQRNVVITTNFPNENLVIRSDFRKLKEALVKIIYNIIIGGEFGDRVHISAQYLDQKKILLVIENQDSSTIQKPNSQSKKFDNHFAEVNKIVESLGGNLTVTMGKIELVLVSSI
jgi:hypothetical protein